MGKAGPNPATAVISRVRVLPPTPTEKLWALSVAAGLVHGTLASYMVFRFSEPGGEWIRWLSFHIGSATILVGAIAFASPSIIFAIPVACYHSRRVVLLTGLLYSVGMWVANFTINMVLHPDLLLPWLGNDFGQLASVALWQIGVSFLAATTATEILFAIVLAFKRLIGRRSITQTGLICWSCGYDLGSPAIETCPECGRPSSARQPPRTRSLVLLQGLARLARMLVIAISLIVLGAWTYIFTTYVLPAKSFLRSCTPPNQTREVVIVAANLLAWTWPRPPVHVLEAGWWIPDPDNPTTGIAVQFDPFGEGTAPSMYVSRADLSWNPTDTPGEELVGGGSPPVFARLSRLQADQVLAARAVPQGLLAAIRETAARVSWVVTSGSTAVGAGEERVVDPDSYFSIPPR